MSADAPVGQPPDKHATRPTSRPQPTKGQAIAGLVTGGATLLVGFLLFFVYVFIA